MPQKILKVLVIPLLLLLLGGLATVVADRLIQDRSVQTYLLSRIGDKIGCDIHAERITVSWRYGIGIRARTVEVVSRTDPLRIQAAGVRIVFSGLRLFQRRIVPTRIDLFQPVLDVRFQKSEGEGAASDAGWIPALVPSLMGHFKELKDVRFLDGKVVLNDGAFGLENLDLHANQKEPAPLGIALTAQAQATCREQKADFAVEATLIENEGRPDDPLCRGTFTARAMPVQWIPWPALVPWQSGRVDARIQVNGSLREGFQSSVSAEMRGCGFEVTHQERHKPYHFDVLKLDADASYAQGVVDIGSFRLGGPGFVFDGRSRFDLQNAADPEIKLEARSGPMPLNVFLSLVPDPILPAWLEKKLFPMLSGGEVVLKGLKIDGSLHRLMALRDAGNAHVFQIGVGWQDLQVTAAWSPLPFQKVPGDLEISDGRLTLTGISATFGDSLLQEGSMIVPSLYGAHHVSEFKLKGDFDFSTLLGIGKSVPFPKELQPFLTQTKSLSGRLKAAVEASFETGAEFPALDTGTLDLADVTWIEEGLRDPLQLRIGHLDINRQGNSRFSASGAWAGSSFDVTGEFGPGWRSGWRIEGAASLDKAGLLRRFGVEGGRGPSFPGRVPCRFSVAEAEAGWALQGWMDVAGMRVDVSGFSLEVPARETRMAFNFTFDPRAWTAAGNAAFDIEESHCQVSGTYGDHRLALHVQTPGFSLADLKLRLGKADSAPIHGDLLADVRMTVPLGEPEKTEVKGQVEGRRMAWVLPGLSLPIAKGEFKLSLDAGAMHIERVSMLLDDARLNLKGNLNGIPLNLRGDVWVDADSLDLSALKQRFAEGFASDSPHDPWRWLEDVDLTAFVSVDRAVWNKRPCGSLNAKVKLSEDGVALQWFGLSMEKTHLALSGHLSRGGFPAVSLSAHIRSEEQPAAAITPFSGLRDIDLEGRLTMEGTFSMRGQRFSDLLGSLSGQGTLLLEQGTIRHSNLLLRIMDALSLRNIAEQRPEGLSKEGFYFESIAGRVTAADGVFCSDDLLMKSPAFNAAAEGSLDLKKRDLALDMGVQPLGTIDSLVSRIPVVGYILSGKDKTILVYHFKVHGPVDKPELDYVPLKDIGGSMMGYLKRLLGTPKRLMEEMDKISKKIKESDTPLPPKDGF